MSRFTWLKTDLPGARHATMKRRPTPPGEMLLEEFLRPAGITQIELAACMGVRTAKARAAHG